MSWTWTLLKDKNLKKLFVISLLIWDIVEVVGFVVVVWLLWQILTILKFG